MNPRRANRGRFQPAHLHRRPTHRDHHHAVGLAEHFVVEVDADDAVGAEFRGRSFHVVERGVARAGQRALVAAGTPADNVAHRREQVAEDVGADDRFAVDDAEVPCRCAVRRRPCPARSWRGRSRRLFSRTSPCVDLLNESARGRCAAVALDLAGVVAPAQRIVVFGSRHSAAVAGCGGRNEVHSSRSRRFHRRACAPRSACRPGTARRRFAVLLPSRPRSACARAAVAAAWRKLQ